MSSKRIRFFITPTLLIGVLLAACTPLRPLTRDGMAGTAPVANELVQEITVAGEPRGATIPLDATPNAAGETIYFTAVGDAGNGLFVVPAAGGLVAPVLVGTPLVQPQGLARGSDDGTLFVADYAADQLFAVNVADGAAQPVDGSAGTHPQGIDAVAGAAGDLLYFTGVDPADGQPAVLTIATTGGEATVIAKGAPFVDPVGITVDDAGAIYVADRGADPDTGGVLKVTDGKVETLATNLHMGRFPGLALTLDGSTLLVSTLATGVERAQVLVIVLATGEHFIVNKVIGANQGAGGLHRAASTNTFAWADAPNTGSGRVYRVRLP
jgi:sugar lactone lactonase YvrE